MEGTKHKPRFPLRRNESSNWKFGVFSWTSIRTARHAAPTDNNYGIAKLVQNLSLKKPFLIGNNKSGGN